MLLPSTLKMLLSPNSHLLYFSGRKESLCSSAGLATFQYSTLSRKHSLPFWYHFRFLRLCSQSMVFHLQRKMRHNAESCYLDQSRGSSLVWTPDLLNKKKCNSRPLLENVQKVILLNATWLIATMWHLPHVAINQLLYMIFATNIITIYDICHL